MPVQSFDDRFLGNAPVPGTGASGGDAPNRNASGKGFPAGVQQASGEDNLRANQQTFIAGATAMKDGSLKDWPKGVQSFKDGL